jgi:predicted GNAT family acetyltransferase
MDILHVFVPIKLRGLLIAEGLAKKAFEIANNQKWKIRPTCTYVRGTFLNRCPELRYLLVQEEDENDF